MLDRNNIYILDAGMITPIGVSLEMTAASIGAGINQYQDSAYFDDDHNPIKMALVPDEALKVQLENVRSISGLTAIEIRLIQLISEALKDINLSLLDKAKPVVVFLAGPSSMTLQFIEVLSELTGLYIDYFNSRSISNGRSGGIYALSAASSYIQRHMDSVVLVIGVDSYNDLDIINKHKNDNRLLTANSTDGFVPGEAASILILSSSPITTNVVLIKECGFGQEDGSIVSDMPYLGDGLTKAFNKALISSRRNLISHIYSSMNGESYWSKELGIAIIRNKSSFFDSYHLSHPSDCYGDIGAATGIALIALAARKLTKSNVDESHLIYCSSDNEHRGAVCIEYIQK